MTKEITKYQAWRFSADRHPHYNKGRETEYEAFQPVYPLAPARDTFEEALADLVAPRNPSRVDGPHDRYQHRFDVVVPNPHFQLAPGDLARKGG